MERTLKTASNGISRPSSANVETLAGDLLAAVTTTHIAHLGIKGPGSYAIHKALNSFYDDLVELADDIIEQYQGATGVLIKFPETMAVPSLKSSEEICSYLKNLRSKIDLVQSNCMYSEIGNVMDEVKSLIDSTCYKLTFLK